MVDWVVTGLLLVALVASVVGLLVHLVQTQRVVDANIKRDWLAAQPPASR